MCGRFFVDAKNRKIDRLLDMLPADDPFPKTGQIYPTDNALALLEDEKPASLSWGFPRYDGKGVVFNARAETALQKPMFAKSLRARPCVIPTNGFYEWHAPEKGAPKDKYLFTSPDNPLLYLAGFWNFFGPDAGANPRHFTFLTTAANSAMLPYHPRMPVLLEARDLPGWLSGSNRAEILAREPFALEAKKV